MAAVFQSVKIDVEITPGAGQGRLRFTTEGGPGVGVSDYAELGKWIGERVASTLDLLHSGPRAAEIKGLREKIAKMEAVQKEATPLPAPAPEPAPQPASVEYRPRRRRD